MLAQELSQAGTGRQDPKAPLQHREQQFRSVFDHSLDATFCLDPQGRFTEINPAGERLSGYAAAELLRMDFSQLLVAEMLPTVWAEFQYALDGRPRHTEAAFLRKDGQRVEVHITGGPIVVNGRTVGVFGIARDITQRKRDEAQIRQLNEELERRVAERTAGLEAANRQLQAEIAQRQGVEEQLRQRGDLQRLTAELATSFIQRKTEQIEEGIHHTLAQIGRFAGADRSYLCVYSDDRTSLTCTHEWCAGDLAEPPGRAGGPGDEQPVDHAAAASRAGGTCPAGGGPADGSGRGEEGVQQLVDAVVPDGAPGAGRAGSRGGGL